MKNKTFYVWITAILEAYADKIIAGLVHKGYYVGALDKDGRISVGNPSDLGVIFGLRISNVEDKIKATELQNIIVKMLKDNKIMYNSIVVSSPQEDCSWNASNITLPKRVFPSKPITDMD